mmetsp:Transcript_60270/g.112620  ORF Transcript_60270/g.112620 Transcript_60270/m.112620 type:complete len:220 (-) Transcript_60270:1319-1978(-)
MLVICLIMFPSSKLIFIIISAAAVGSELILGLKVVAALVGDVVVQDCNHGHREKEVQQANTIDGVLQVLALVCRAEESLVGLLIVAGDHGPVLGRNKVLLVELGNILIQPPIHTRTVPSNVAPLEHSLVAIPFLAFRPVVGSGGAQHVLVERDATSRHHAISGTRAARLIVAALLANTSRPLLLRIHVNEDLLVTNVTLLQGVVSQIAPGMFLLQGVCV